MMGRLRVAGDSAKSLDGATPDRPSLGRLAGTRSDQLNGFDECNQLQRNRPVGLQVRRVVDAEQSATMPLYFSPLSRGVFSPVADFDIRDLRVFLAIWLSRNRRVITKAEIARTRFTQRPAAGDHASIRPRRYRLQPWHGSGTWCGHHRTHGRGCHHRHRAGAGQRRKRRPGNPRHGGPTRPRRRAVAADRRWTGGEIKPVSLADHRIFRDSQPSPDFGCGVPVAPEQPQPLDDVVCPLHFVVSRPNLPLNTVSGVRAR